MEKNKMNIGGGTRKMAPDVAGGFYPSDPALLRRTVNTLIREAEAPSASGNLKALIVPHAGYIYSGPVAAKGYRLVRDLEQTKTWEVIIVGPAHYVPFKGVCVGLYDEFATPLGSVKVSKSTWKFLDSGAIFLPQAHENEHCIEVQLPFLHHCLRNFEIIPILTGSVDPVKVADMIEPFLDDDTILLISTDLSHQLPYERAREIDTQTLDWIIRGDEHSLKKHGEACGLTGIISMLELSKRLDWRRELIAYATSGDTYGPKNRVVGYGCVACFK